MWQEGSFCKRLLVKDISSFIPVTFSTKGFKAKYDNVKAKLALLGFNASAPSSSSGKNKGLSAKTYDWDEEEVSSDDNELTEVKALMALTDEERVSVGKESANNDNLEMSITGSNKPKLSEAKDFTLSNHDTADESSVCNTPLPPLEKLTGAEPVSGPKTIKSILKSKSTFKAETLKGITINEPSSAPIRGNKSSSASKTNLALADFQDSLDDEEDTRSSHKYLNNLEEEYQAISLLAKSERFFKKAHFARDCWSKTLVPSYQSPFQPKLLHSSEHKPEPRYTKGFKAKYDNVKAKLALLGFSAFAPSSSSGKNKGLSAETYDWDEEEVSSDDNELTEVKGLMALTDEERVSVGKESTNNENIRNDQLTKDTSSSGPKDPVFIKSSADNLEMSITGSNKPKLSEAKDFTLPNHDTGKVPSNVSQRNTTDHSVVVSDSSVTVYDSADESSVCNTLLPLLEKLTGAEPVSGPKTIKSILKSKSTFKAKTLKGITINEPSSASIRGNKSSSASKTNLALAGKLKNVKIEDHPPLAIVMKEINELKLQFIKNKSS
nr:hypothetical protein [Tanacetum cinerariifolium]